MVQHVKTPSGYVLHKVVVPGCKGHFSAWFDAAGFMVDAEQKPGGFGSTTRNVKVGGPAWVALQETGRPYAAR